MSFPWASAAPSSTSATPAPAASETGQQDTSDDTGPLGPTQSQQTHPQPPPIHTDTGPASYFSQPTTGKPPARPFYTRGLSPANPANTGTVHNSDSDHHHPLQTPGGQVQVPQTPLAPTTLSRSTTLNLPGFRLNAGPGLGDSTLAASYARLPSQSNDSLPPISELRPNYTMPDRNNNGNSGGAGNSSNSTGGGQQLHGMAHLKLRSPSLPVNSVSKSPAQTPVTIPPSVKAMTPSELAHLLSGTTTTLPKPSVLVIDVRSFNNYSQRRIRSAVNICIPSTLLRRPAYVFARFGECMIPTQREAITDLARYTHIVLYDQATQALPQTEYSALVQTVVKLDQSKSVFGGVLAFLQGGFAAFAAAKEAAGLVDESEVLLVSGGEPTYSNENTAAPSNTNFHTAARKSVDGGAPVLTGFSLPATSTQEGPLKPFASHIRNSLDHANLEQGEPIALPPGLDPKGPEVQQYFPAWLRDIIDPQVGPRYVVRKFHNIEEAEKVRLQRAFGQGKSGSGSAGALAVSSPFGGPPPREDYHSQHQHQHQKRVNYTFSAGLELGSKNRYSNIWPYDHTRVRLPGRQDPQSYNVTPLADYTADDDYFNASYITTKKTHLRYIATQGPLPDTFSDFWHVVWTKKIPVIVMLTSEFEGGAIKCHRYWENGLYGRLSLTKTSSERVVLSERTGTLVTIRKFVLAPSAAALAKERSDGGTGTGAGTGTGGVGTGQAPHHSSYYNPFLSSESHTVIQIQYTAWPDLGAPAAPDDLVQLCRIKNAYLDEWREYLKFRSGGVGNSGGEGPGEVCPWTIVHCSAGCGRTGTFCTVDSVISALSQQQQRALANGDATASSSSPFDLSPHVALDGITSEGEDNGRPDDHAGHGTGSGTGHGRDNTVAASMRRLETQDLVFRTVHKLRRQRLSMVQVLRQYVLCYETVIVWIHEQYLAAQQRQEKSADLI